MGGCGEGEVQRLGTVGNVQSGCGMPLHLLSPGIA